MSEAARETPEDDRWRIIRAQGQTMFAILTTLVRECRDRFIAAGRLLDVNDGAFPHLRRPLPDEPIEVARLQGLYEVVALRYLRDLHDPQIQLAEPAEEWELRRWTAYAYWALVPKIVADDAMARDVMRAVGAHPGRSPESAANALVNAAINMAMPPRPQPAHRNLA